MRKATFDKRMKRLHIIAQRASMLPMDEARSLVLETKALRQFNGLMRDFLYRYAGVSSIPRDE